MEGNDWVDSVLQKAKMDYKLEEFLKIYKFDQEPSSDIRTRTTILEAKQHLDEVFDEWLAYMEVCSEEVYGYSFHQDIDNGTPWDIINWFEAYFHSYVESGNNSLEYE